MFKFGFRFIRRIPFYHDMFTVFNCPPRLILPEAALPAVVAEVRVRLQFHAFCIEMPHLAFAVFANVLCARSAVPESVPIAAATSIRFRRLELGKYGGQLPLLCYICGGQ